MNLSEGVTVESLDGCDEYKNFLSKQKAFEGFVRLQPYDQVMPKIYCQFEKTVKELQIRDDDVWIASFPKCGEERIKACCCARLVANATQCFP